MSEPTSLSEFLPAESLVQSLGISRSVLLSWIDHGLPSIRVGKRLYFHEASVAAWLKRRERVQDLSA